MARGLEAAGIRSRRADVVTTRGENTLRARALRLLARRDHTRAELTAKLRREGADAEALERLLDDFSRRGWISEARVVEQVSQARRSRYGSRRIRRELQEKGVPDELIEEAMRTLSETDLDAARRVWRRKYGRPAEDAAERARQIRFLQYRGFPLELALRVVSEAGRADAS